MSRDHRKLHVFHLADRLVLDVYRASKRFPAEERFGLRADLRSSALSAAVNIVEGSARLHHNEYVHFLNIANASASEARYLSDVSGRLEFLTPGDAELLEQDYRELCGRMTSLIASLARGKRNERA